MLNDQSILEVLKAVKYPGFSRDIISFGIVKHVAAGDGAVSVQLQLTTANPDIAKQIREECERHQCNWIFLFMDIKRTPNCWGK